jgi:hypothetical protein
VAAAYSQLAIVVRPFSCRGFFSGSISSTVSGEKATGWPSQTISETCAKAGAVSFGDYSLNSSPVPNMVAFFHFHPRLA